MKAIDMKIAEEYMGSTDEELSKLNSWEKNAIRNISNNARLGYIISNKQIAIWWKLHETVGNNKSNIVDLSSLYQKMNDVFLKSGKESCRPLIQIKEIRIRKNSMYGIHPENYAVTSRDRAYHYGSIRSNGEFYRKPECSDEVVELLEALNKDLHEVIYDEMQKGEEHHCVFCARKLTNEASITVGYGPDCAANYGLPWGELV